MRPIILEKEQQTSSLGLPELIPQLQACFAPNRLLYLLDFTLSVLAGNILLVLASRQLNGSLLQILLAVAAAPALFRASAFIHEISHAAKKIKGAELYYNLLHGFLHKAPSYIYDSHRYHHMPRTYGTLEDPEYDNLGDRSYFYVLVFSPFLLMLVSPLFLIIRWAIMPAFLPFIGEKRRLWVYRHMSTLVMNLKYVRPAPTETEKKEWYAQDAGCFLYTLAVLGLLFAGVLSWNILPLWYLAAYVLGVMNYLRVLLNHRYLTNFEASTHKQQVLDSVTYAWTPFNAMLYPVGLGYHALHHMFPQIPYHNLGKAHRYLMENLPQDHPYRLTLIVSYPQGLKQLLKRRF